MGNRVRGWLFVCAALLVGLGAHAWLQTPLDKDLVVASAKGDVAAVTALLAKGANVRATNEYGTTPIYFAGDQASVPLAKLLLDHGADADQRDLYYGKSALRVAAVPYNGLGTREDRAEIIKLILAKGFGSDGEALGDLIRARFYDAAKEIITRGKAKQPYLNVALESARRAQQPELVDLLTKAGAKDPGPLDSGRSPEWLKAVTGVYRSPSGQTVTLRPSLHEDELWLERADGTRAVLLGTELTLLRSQDMKVAVWLKAGVLPPAEVTVVDGGRTGVFTRTGDAPAAPAPAPAKPAAAAPRPPSAPAAPVVRTTEWPSFRGAFGEGNGDGMHPPTTWDLEKGTNIKWKTPIPGLAHASPVIWGNRVFILGAAPKAETAMTFRHSGALAGAGASAYTKDEVPYAWRMYALDKQTGKIVWDRVVYEGVPITERHVMQSQADATPATDGKYLVVFLGSEGLYCYDVDGKPLWKRSFGPLNSGRYTDPSYQWKTAGSPIIYKNMVFLQVDLMKTGFVAAFDLKTGKDIWRTQRDDIPSWGTPLVYEGPKRVELITAGGDFARSYDPKTGKELWRLGKHSELPMATPIAGDGLIFLCSGNGQTIQPIYAVRPGATGDITLKEDQESNEWVVWSTHRGGPGMSTPLFYGGLLYVSGDSGTLSAYDAVTGERVYQVRLTRGGSFSASGVAADGKIYYANQDGVVVVVKAGRSFEKLAEIQMGELVIASPAISPNMIIFRTQHQVVAVESR